MANSIPSLDKLMDCFASLPGVGRKTASRFAYKILDMDEEDALAFAQSITDVRKNVHHCPVCHNLTDDEKCSICADENRDRSIICVVETAKDVSTIEATHEYKGLYHVLGGLINPIQGIGPEQLYIKELISRLSDETVTEIIMATNPTVEGESTAIYLSRLLKPIGVKVTRLATGLPMGGNMEYADKVTLLKALEGRKEL